MSVVFAPTPILDSCIATALTKVGSRSGMFVVALEGISFPPSVTIDKSPAFLSRAVKSQHP